ncbi:uncharacterized protein LOC123510928 [Portunus trituberculatus]|uniref:uncharacterized protein LOC123510928 n=1 Tax=Portunus trituberculatus TaxID=210409 RepID=UPI001E1CB7A3|nr:uncharacterized protein LOC123510928 [Portunus trituberculatus]XP_045122363.1 uncharacterized protein LOC123510928 [Portunus trituberculatus]
MDAQPTTTTTTTSSTTTTTLWRRLLPLFLLIPSACGIRCYECVHNNQRVKRHNRFVYPCSEFDDSERYIMDCPDSNMCIYQRITLPLSSGKVHVTTMDGCTPNITSQARYAEARLVKPGCITQLSAERPPSSEYCYCDYNLCNNGSITSISLLVSVLPLLLVSLHWLLQDT